MHLLLTQKPPLQIDFRGVTMSRFIRIDDKSILNFYELQKNFEPLALMENLDEFKSFAAVHCIPLPLYYTDNDNERQKAEHITKEFMNFLLNLESVPQTESAWDYLYSLLISRCEVISGVKNEDGSYVFENWQDEKQWKDEYLRMEEEIAFFKLREKLDHIIASGKLTNSIKDELKSIILLAICEMSEVDARKYSFKGACEFSDKMKNENPILPFTYTHTVNFETRSMPYRFKYHDEDVLSAEKTIHTVRINAIAGRNKYETVKIELYSDNGEIIQQIKLNNGEYRHCNVSNEKVIKFLPTISAGREGYMVRESYDSSEITIITDEKDPITFMESRKRDISSFNFLNTNSGFSYIIDNKLRLDEKTSSYPELNYIKNVVEAVLIDDGYILLNKYGITNSNKNEFDGIKTVSLDKYSRGKFHIVNLLNESATEISVSDDKKCIVVRTDEDNIITRNKNRGESFEIIEENGQIIINL